MKLYTKRGDQGQTDLFGGQRVAKDDPRVVAYGEVDATSAALGLVVALGCDADTASTLQQIQSDLFGLGAELACAGGSPPAPPVSDAQIAQLERWIDAATTEAGPLRQFILPGGAPPAAALHVARTTCRRAERCVVTLAAREPVSPGVLVYLNRLSDLLFALARVCNRRAGTDDLPWTASRTNT